jgi:uncharacterized protein (TIGR02147 family)
MELEHSGDKGSQGAYDKATEAASVKALEKPRAWNFVSTREFVAAFDTWARCHHRGYSRRAFARWAGVASPNFLTLIISGKRPLSRIWLGPFVKAAKLDALEREYLSLLVDLESSSSAQVREGLVEAMDKLLNEASVTSLAGDRLALLRNPVAWTLLHMLGLEGQDGQPKWFKSRLRKKLSVPELRQSLDLLERLGLLETLPDGSLRAREARLLSPDQLEKAQNYEFHRFVLSEASEILETLDPRERAFGSLTVVVARDKETEFRAEVARFGQQLLKKYGMEGKVDGDLFRMNLQLYPLTQPSDTQNSESNPDPDV